MRPLRTMLAVVLFANAVRQSAAVDLITAPGRNSQTCEWSPFDAKPSKITPPGSEPAYEFSGGPYGMTGSIIGISLMRPPGLRVLKLSASFRATAPNQSFAIDIVGVDKSIKTGLPWTAEWNIEGKLPPSKWTAFERDICLPSNTTYLRIVIHNPNPAPILLTAPHLLLGNASEPDKAAVDLANKEKALYAEEQKHPTPTPVQVIADKYAKQRGPVVAHVQIRAPLCTKKFGEKGTVTFPVPGLSGGQIPLAFHIVCNNPGKLIGYAWRKRPDGRNYVCEVTAQPGVKGAWVVYDALVLLGGPNQRELSPDSGWAQSTACVQSSDPKILAIEKKLAASGESEESYARKVYEFVFKYGGKGAPFKALDALAALECGGSCTNKANLSAALLRAHGIPARTVAHMPTWCPGKMYEHWLTEYWEAGKGWVALDAALGRFMPDRRTRVVLAISNPSDENRAFEPLHERFVMPGAPYLSVAELSSTLYPADLAEDDAINLGEQIALLDTKGATEEALFKSAAKSFAALYPKLEKGDADPSRYAKVLAAAKSGKTAALMAAIR